MTVLYVEEVGNLQALLFYIIYTIGTFIIVVATNRGEAKTVEGVFDFENNVIAFAGEGSVVSVFNFSIAWIVGDTGLAAGIGDNGFGGFT